MESLDLDVALSGITAQLIALQGQLPLVDRIRQVQTDTLRMQQFRKMVEIDHRTYILIHPDGSLRLDGKLCVPEDNIKEKVLKETQIEVHDTSRQHKDVHGFASAFLVDRNEQGIAKFMARCLFCYQVKAEYHRTVRFLQPLPIHEWKWEEVTMNFVTELLMNPKDNNIIWVIVNRLTKSAHFILFGVGQFTEVLAHKYLQKVVRLHWISVEIISDRETRFTLYYQNSLQEALGMKLAMPSAFHPQIDGQQELAIQILEDILRTCVLDFGGSWEEHLYMAKFAYINSYEGSIGMPLFEALYGKSVDCLYIGMMLEKRFGLARSGCLMVEKI